MSLLTLLSKAVLLAGGSIAVGATMQTLTAPVMLSDEPRLVKTWGQLTLVAERPGATVTRLSSEGVGFRLGPILAAPTYPEEEDVGFAVGPVHPAPTYPAEDDAVAAAPEQPGVERRERPDPQELAAAVRTLRPAVQRCYDTGMVPGQIVLTLTVSGKTGRVLEASVSDESSTGRCLQQVGQTVRFTPFAQPRLTIRLPFSFR